MRYPIQRRRPGLFVIAREMFFRFIRLWLWVPALILPLSLFFLALIKGSSPLDLAQKVMLDCLLYLLPSLAIISILTSVDRSRWDLILIRPIRRRSLILGIWLGGILPYLLCYLVLIVVVMGVCSFYEDESGGEESTAVEYHGDFRFWRGSPSRPLPPPEPIPIKKLEWLKMKAPWTFELRGIKEIANSSENGGKLEGRFLSEVGRAVVEKHDNDKDHAVLYKAGDIPVVVRFVDEDENERCPPVHLTLEDQKPVPFYIPASAVLDDDRILVVVEKDTHEHHDHEEEHQAHDGERHLHSDSSLVFWFDRVLQGSFRPDDDYRFKPSLTSNYTPYSGLLVVSRRRSVGENFLRIGLLAMGLLPLLVSMATFTVAMFGPAVAFAFNLTIFLCGVSMSFLKEVVESLSIASSSMILGDPTKAQILRKPTWFDSLLESYLKFWISVLPDFQIFQGARFLIGGEVASWPVIMEGYGWSLLYAVLFLCFSVLFLWRREKVK